MNKTGKYARGFALVVAAMVLVLVGGSMTPFSGDQSCAAQGCCMKRQCPDDNCTWYVMEGSYQGCNKLNDQRDGDDVHSQDGLIRWSPTC